MIKVAIKHFIYEGCINVFFDSIVTNFRMVKRTLFQPGDTFTHMKIRINERLDFFAILYDCSIVDELEGTVLIRHYAKAEENGLGDVYGNYEDYGEAVDWRVNIHQIIGYERV